MPLDQYRAKRDFAATPEPSGEGAAGGDGALRYVIQEHAATAHHYDLRLELDGVLLSWAVPKGPSLDPHDKRLAVHVEDHPIDYADFEGIIPQPEYGAGTVAVWDRGTWEPDGDPHAGLKRGDLKFELHGEKLRGTWVLVRMKPREHDRRENWLFIKERDAEAEDGGEPVTSHEPLSVLSGRTLAQVREEERADPPKSSGSGGSASRTRTRAPASKGKSASRGATATKAAPKSADTKTDQPLQAPKVAMPSWVEPELAKLVEGAPRGDGWISEVKYDGYRALVFLKDGQAKALSRRENDWSDRFAPIVEAAEKLPAQTAILDGEVVVFDDQGISGFQLLQAAIGAEPQSLVYVAFDLVYLNGYDLRDLPLLRRKELLAELLRDEPPAGPIRFAEHVTGDPEGFYERACRTGLEGSICKRADSRYLGKRDGTWVKVKCRLEEEFVVGGYTDPRGARGGFGALLLGYYDGDHLVYAGRVGTGFNEKTLAELYERFSRHERKTTPFSNAPRAKGVHWTRPDTVVEVAFREWTSEGILRQPAYLGLREDKDPHEVTREVPSPSASDDDSSDSGDDPSGSSKGSPATAEATAVAGIKISNPDKKLLPESDVTKLQLATFYEAVADVMLPHVVERPLTLLRCPVGEGRGCFYQRHPDAGLPKQVHTLNLVMPDGEPQTGLYITDVSGLVALAQMGVAEIHTWGSRIDAIDQPDRIIFDLDPGPGVTWPQIRKAALLARDALDDLGLKAFVKTTGGKGLHVTVPIEPIYHFERVRAFAKSVVDGLVAEHPDLVHGRMAKSERGGKIFMDYLRNSFGASAVAPYSTRARQGGPVSVPITWNELTDDLDPRSFTVETVLKRVKSHKDPWSKLDDAQASSRTLRAAFSAMS